MTHSLWKTGLLIVSFFGASAALGGPLDAIASKAIKLRIRGSKGEGVPRKIPVRPSSGNEGGGEIAGSRVIRVPKIVSEFTEIDERVDGMVRLGVVREEQLTQVKADLLKLSEDRREELLTRFTDHGADVVEVQLQEASSSVLPLTRSLAQASPVNQARAKLIRTIAEIHDEAIKARVRPVVGGLGAPMNTPQMLKILDVEAPVDRAPAFVPAAAASGASQTTRTAP